MLYKIRFLKGVVFMRMSVRRRRIYFKAIDRKKFNVFLVFASFFAILFFTSSLFNTRAVPILKAVAEANAKNIAIKTINDAVLSELERLNITYSDLVNIEKNNDGQVIAVSSNIVNINKIKSALSKEIQKKLQDENITGMKIPIGNFFDSDLLSGIGPYIKFKMLPVGFSEIDVKNNFTSSGINQTKHEIYLEINTAIKVLMPLSSTSTTVTTTVPIAQTIIVGTVPENYTHVTGTTGNGPDTVLEVLE